MKFRVDVALKILKHHNKCNIGQIDKYGNTALIWSCFNCLEKVVLKILELHNEFNIECNIRQINKIGSTELTIARERNLQNIVSLLEKYSK